ncbi:MAG TPA: YfiR family protein [Gammaproteobacteria bacterium]
MEHPLNQADYSMMNGFICKSRLVRRMPRMACILLFAGLVAWGQCPANPEEDAATLETRLKAVSLFKFASYVDWPEQAFPDPAYPITIAVMDGEAIVSELTRMVAGRTAQGRPVRIKRVHAGEAVTGVHILFVGADEAGKLERMADVARMHSILTVTDFTGGLARGGVINFVLAERRLRFEIALDTAQKSGLKLSSRLLDVALRVDTGGR